MRILIQFILVVFIITSCGGQSKTQGPVPVKGKVTNHDGKHLLFQHLASAEPATLDTIKIRKDGSFEVKAKVTETGFYRLFADSSNFIILALDSSSRVQVEADLRDFSNSYTVKGSPESQEIKELFSAMRQFDRNRDSLTVILQSSTSSPDFNEIQARLTNEYQRSEAQRAEILKEFVQKNSASIVSLIAIGNMKYEEHPELFRKVYTDLSAKYPGSPVIEPYLQAYRQMSKLGAGEEAPEIIMNTPQGEPLALSSLRGKYVLIDFWASWCRPCRMENPNVVKVYQKYKDKGFEILGVSLDRDRDQWIKAIADDNLTWKHISDLAFWSSSVVKSYQISGIPFTVLVDPEGRIIAKNLRAESLENKLAEIFGSH